MNFHDRRCVADVGRPLRAMRCIAAVAAAFCVSLPAAGDELMPEGLVLAIDGTGVGPIPDGPGTPTLCGVYGAPLNITFQVPDLMGAYLDNVDVTITFSEPHTFAGDVTAILIAPGGTRQQVLFGQVGSTAVNGCGDSSDLAGPYVFTDAATPPSGGFWQAATTAGSTVAIAAGSYFATESGGAGAVNPMPPVSLGAIFGGLSSSEAEGNWTLRMYDSGGQDTGTVGSARLSLHLDLDRIFADGFEA